MKIPVLVSLACLLLPGLTSVAQVHYSARQLLEMDQYKRAKAAFISEQKTTGASDNWFYLGKIYFLQHDADSARYCFGKLSGSDPKNLLSQVGQAISETLNGNVADALNMLDKAQRQALSAKDITSLLEIAQARYQAGDSLNWQQTLELASTIDRKDPRPFITAGNIYSAWGELINKSAYYGLASGRYRQALYLQPQNTEALTRLSAIDIKILNYDDAEAMLTLALKTDPLYLPALKNMGELLYMLGRYKEAGDYYSRYIKLAEYNDKDLARFVNILFFDKEYTLALEYINKVLRTNPANPVMLRLKGYSAYELNRNEEGIDAMAKLFDLRSGSDSGKLIASDYEYYGKLLGRQGHDSLAVQNLLKAFEMDRTNTALMEETARLYEKMKQYPEAIQCYEKLVEAKKTDVSSLIYFNMGKDMLLLAEVLKQTPDSLQRSAWLMKADTAFGMVVTLSPASYLGYQWRARARAGLDPETMQGFAKTDYEKTLEILESKNEPKKYASDLIEAYRYLGYYYYLQYEAGSKAGDMQAREQARGKSLEFWQKVIELDPENAIARQAIGALKKSAS